MVRSLGGRRSPFLSDTLFLSERSHQRPANYQILNPKLLIKWRRLESWMLSERHPPPGTKREVFLLFFGVFSRFRFSFNGVSEGL